MSEPVRTALKCQDPSDRSGDVIIEVPQDLLQP